MVVGGEAKRWARDEEKAGRPRRDGPARRRPRRPAARGGPLLEPVEVAHRLWDPVQQYAMIDNALRAAEGRTTGRAAGRDRRPVGADERRVGRQPGRRLRRDARTPAWLATPSPDNRPLAFPYNKWHSTQWTVNQAAALVLCSVEAARRAGVPDRPLGLPPGGAGVEPRRVGAVPASASTRGRPWRSSGTTAAARIGRPVGRDRGGRGLQLLSVGRPGPAAGTRPAARRDPHGDRGHGVRRRPVQQLRPAVDGGGGAPTAGRSRALWAR